MNEPVDRPDLRLAMPLGEWRISLRTGGELRLAAHAYSEEDEMYTFSILMDGSPAFYVDVLRVPAALVSKIEGG
jgi:hypothetical protein